jgi:hypothetical protein
MIHARRLLLLALVLAIAVAAITLAAWPNDIFDW